MIWFLSLTGMFYCLEIKTYNIIWATHEDFLVKGEPLPWRPDSAHYWITLLDSLKDSWKRFYSLDWKAFEHPLTSGFCLLYEREQFAVNNQVKWLCSIYYLAKIETYDDAVTSTGNFSDSVISAKNVIKKTERRKHTPETSWWWDALPWGLRIFEKTDTDQTKRVTTLSCEALTAERMVGPWHLLQSHGSSSVHLGMYRW